VSPEELYQKLMIPVVDGAAPEPGGFVMGLKEM
jgi:hypothetical protein